MFSKDYFIPSTNILLRVFKLYLIWRYELVKEEGYRLDRLQASWCKFKITSINLIAIKYSMIFFVLFGGQEGFGYLIFLWRYELDQALRIYKGATKCATECVAENMF
jgi:hypothetical protein